MATIQARTTAAGKTSYRVMIRLKGHPPQTATFERKTDARRWAQQTEAAIREGRHFKSSEAKRRTLGELIDRYVRDVLPQKRPTTQAAQRYQFAWWKEQMGYRALADITPALIADYRDRLSNTMSHRGTRMSPAYVNRHLVAFVASAVGAAAS